MRNAFLETADDCQWLRDTCLKNVTLPAAYADFKSAILQGNEDAPYAVNLYVSQSPNVSDNFLRVAFGETVDIAEYDARTGRPIGAGMTESEIHTAAQHFIIACLWADCPEGTHPRATRDAKQWALQFVQRFNAAHPGLCAAVLAHGEYGYGSHHDAGSPAAAFGHDLYLTCAGHGAGFWDRSELGESGDRISDAIRKDWREWHIEAQFYRGWLYF